MAATVRSLLYALALCILRGVEGGWSDSARAEEPPHPAEPASPSIESSTVGPVLWNPLTWKWVPTDVELRKYRSSWNPMSNGPILNTGVDVQPKGQFLVQPFVFGEWGHQRYGNQLSASSQDSPNHLQALSPTLIFAYGITENFEADIIPGTSWLWFQSDQPNAPGHPRTTEFSIGDTTIYLKNRVVVQDPGTWRPTFTMFHQLVLPSSQWFATKGIPGGFSPLGRLPATKFGALSLTEGAMFRKNLEPFRFTAGVYYSYTVPGSTAGMNTYIGDIINTRFIIEHILSDKHGFGYSLEFVTLHGLSWRADGHPINTFVVPNTHATTFNLFGVEPAVQFKLFQSDTGALVGAAGVLFSIAGQNDINAIYPNLSLYYYWAKKGQKVMMR